MYFVVPKDRSVIKSIAKFDNMWDAQVHANKARNQSGEHFDVINMTRVYSTQKMDELIAQDLADEAQEAA